MSHSIDLGPLRLSRDDDGCCFTLSAPAQLTLNIPTDYDRVIADMLRDVAPSGQSKPARLDLQNLPALSSRQLGLMLALHKALRSRHERLRLTGVHDNVKKLLEITKTIQFFDLA